MCTWVTPIELNGLFNIKKKRCKIGLEICWWYRQLKVDGRELGLGFILYMVYMQEIVEEKERKEEKDSGSMLCMIYEKSDKVIPSGASGVPE